ncbi:MAG: TonB-dependent receptor domain-containing protein, partial [Gemmatimonadota bacterium]
DQVQAATQTDRLGRYLFGGLEAGSYAVEVSRLGYHESAATSIDVTSEGRTVDIALVPLAFTLDPVVVTASMSDETKLDSPVSASVVPRLDIEESAVPTAADHLKYVPGVDFSHKGIATHAFSTRGPRNLTPESMLFLSDYRYAAVPYLRTNTALLVPYMAEDVERVEVIRGPGAVLYGPNSRRGVVHVIRRSPLGPDETTVSILGGEREYFDGAFRLSRSFADSTIGFKLSGRYVRGREWPFADSVEIRLRNDAIGLGADPDTLLLGLREEDVEGLYGEARVDWRPSENSLLATTAGISRATGIETGGEAGAAQALDWSQGYVHSRFENGALFANFSFNWGDAGDTYNLRNGIGLTNRSQLVTGQVQHEWRLGATRLLTGTDVLWTIPRTEGTLNGQFESDDNVVETGLYAYATTALSPRFDLITALRADHHNRLDRDWFLSPRAGIVVKPSPTHSFRFAYSRTFEQPTTRSMFADFSLGPLGPLPYNIQLFGLGGDGLRVVRECGGLCMRTPDAFGGMGGTLLAAEATSMWPVIVGALAAQGVDISGLPAPTAADVATVFGALNFTSGAFDPVPAAS